MTDNKIPLRTVWIFSFLSMAIGAVYYHFYASTISLMQTDSSGYVSFAAARTVGYPLFLLGINKLLNGYTYLPLIQLSFHFLSATILSLIVSQLTRSLLLGFLLLGFLLGNIEWVQFDFMILTESISTSCLLLLLSVLIRFYRWQKTLDLMLISLLIGILILIRPVCYALLPVIGGMLFLIWPQIKSRLLVLFTPLIFVLCMGATVQWYKNGFWGTESFLGHNLLGKAAIIVDADVPSKYPEAIGNLSNMAAPIQKTLKGLPSWQMEYIFRTPYYDYLRYTYADKTAKASAKENDQYWQALAFDIIKAKSWLYIKDVLINYFALWFLWDLATPQEALVMQNEIKERHPFPIYKDFPLPPRTTKAAHQWRMTALVVRGSLIASFIISFIILGYVWYLRLHNKPVDTLLKIAFTTALIAHGLNGLTSLLQAGLARYSLFAWPAIGVMMLCIIGFLWKKYQNDRT